MGTFYVEAKVGGKSALKARVDTGATFSKLPADLLKSLGVKPAFTTKVELGDGRIVARKVRYVALRKLTLIRRSNGAFPESSECETVPAPSEDGGSGGHEAHPPAVAAINRMGMSKTRIYSPEL